MDIQTREHVMPSPLAPADSAAPVASAAPERPAGNGAEQESVPTKPDLYSK